MLPDHKGQGTPGTHAPRVPSGWKRSPGLPPAYGISPNCSPLTSLQPLSETQAEQQRGTWRRCGHLEGSAQEASRCRFPLSPPQYQVGRSQREGGRHPKLWSHAGGRDLHREAWEMNCPAAFCLGFNLSGFL